MVVFFLVKRIERKTISMNWKDSVMCQNVFIWQLPCICFFTKRLIDNASQRFSIALIIHSKQNRYTFQARCAYFRVFSLCFGLDVLLGSVWKSKTNTHTHHLLLFNNYRATISNQTQLKKKKVKPIGSIQIPTPDKSKLSGCLRMKCISIQFNRIELNYYSISWLTREL